MFYTIYKITNLIDAKIYIGKHQTKDLNDGYMGSGKLLKRAQEKYGIENFAKEILFQFDNEDEMNAKEAELVTEEFCLREDTYNLCPGGQGGWGYLNSENGLLLENRSYSIYNWNKQAREKHHILLKYDLEYKKKYSDKTKDSRIKAISALKEKYPNGTFYCKKHTEETKNKMRKTKNVGEANSQFGTMWITNGQKNKKIKKEDFIPEGWYKGRSKIIALVV